VEETLDRSTRLAVAIIATLAVGWPADLEAQTMEEVLGALFTFSSGQEPLFLAGSADASSTQVHGDHFIPAEAAANGALLGIFTSTIASNISNFPLSSTVSSQTFRFVGGVPTPTSSSFGPIFAERAQTMGSGRFDVGMNYTAINFGRLRGIPLDDVGLSFLHDNVDFEGCDEIQGGDCTQFGLPLAEHATIDLGLNLGIEAKIYAFNAVVGVLDWMDVAVSMPVVDLSIDGVSSAQISPASVTGVQHFFSGTPENPVLTASSASRGSTVGLGDVAVRTKLRLVDGDQMDFGVLGEVRLPTGREEDFLGAGATSVRGMFIASGTFGGFSPHMNFGYLVRSEEVGPDVFQFAVGFDQRLSENVTFVVDALGDIQMEDSLEFPQSATLTYPVTRTLDLTNVPNIRDDLISGAVGFKFRTSSGIIFWANALVALNDGGLRDPVVPSFGLQFSPR
jgi:hypothetical protein